MTKRDQISGFTTSYTDPNTGVNLPDAWIQIRNIIYTPYVDCALIVDVYKDLQSFQEGMTFVFGNVFPQSLYGDENWQNYFDPTVMNLQAESIDCLQNNL